ncbi:gluconate 2-dehydrogenase subunit 3 family protein [Neptunicella marina]|uniref:Gluconate 2-dehydrogenase subunit 3 family protein n=1 Tax=Neptunicella marina TaxID=2125989 RepID=A0A8J6M3E7_9ALTE|nr:gluconate 2-dehydrogenase subunit 3 family protein [Neptunicella marina]MBC3766927.1 gluconate 2-dehydrogenase subunit 3 family protein [Neptunicella marina]
MKDHETYTYKPGMTRRESLKWLGLIAAGTSVATMTACSPAKDVVTGGSAGHWPDLDIKPVTAKGYGTDPNMVVPPESPWPRTLNQQQLTLVAILSDIIVPREGSVPSATEVNVPDVIDEWVSAPYDGQQRDRVTILHGLAWIDDEANLRFKKPFATLDKSQQTAIIDDIAYRTKEKDEEFGRARKAFARLKQLVLAAFFCSPQGHKDIGYMGNVAIAGDYPGPTDEARAHLDGVLKDLGLSEFAYQES